MTRDREGLVLVVRGVPAQVCNNCGEECIDERTTRELIETAEEAAGGGPEELSSL